MLLGLLAAATVLPGTARAQAPPGTRVAVVEVSGLIDPVLVDFLAEAVTEAAAREVEALVIRLDSPGGVVSPPVLDGLVQLITRSPVPVAVWVGPSRDARAVGQAFAIFRAADVAGLAPGARVGDGPPRASGGPDPLADRTISGEDAQQVLGAGIVLAPTLGDFIVSLDGKQAAGTTIAIPTKVVERDGGPPQRQLEEGVQVSFAEPPLVDQVLHAVATPSAAYLLLVIALLLIVFEFFTAGIGVAAGVGATCFLLAAYGLGVLPTRWWAVALLAVGVFGFSVDVQAGAPRAWTVIGSASLVAGTLTLYDGFRVPLLAMVVGLAGTGLFMVAGMPAMVRTRFATPTIGRDSMIGEQGEAVSDVAPEGVVRVRDATWPARTNRATPIRRGEALRVAAIDGLLLEVEPLEGAARDARH